MEPSIIIEQNMTSSCGILFFVPLADAQEMHHGPPLGDECYDRQDKMNRRRSNKNRCTSLNCVTYNPCIIRIAHRIRFETFCLFLPAL